MGSRKVMLFAAVLLVMTSVFASDLPAPQSWSSKPWEVNVTLRSSIYLPTPRPVADVYVELNNSTPSLVYRVERNQTQDPVNLAKMAYATTNATPHDPYKIMPNALGPFPKGAPLGFTLGEWLDAIGVGTYIEENGNASIDLTFHNLVPNGTYSVWCHRVTSPPNYREENSPLGAPDGTQNIFKADASGNGTFYLKSDALPATTNVTYKDWLAMYVTRTAPLATNITWTLIGVVYHSDGQTHCATPGEFGKNAHLQLVHLMYPKPARTFEEWRNATVTAATNTPENAKKQPGFEIINAIAGLLAIVYFALGKRR